ncbi:HK97 gp10 family phage protein [Clostridium sp. MSJ-11]|uniref:HK97 gp10 family phage protein n=1 Tax=Clostridium mobile TaxID=2841512 RepID=A0ABS6ENL0_9CLOT|nr:HK97-gp10 family putative phage morphogenesis protein [Clostridium mobile]MBU5485964.1 HK97 gp10 family phage protein [Clostridium mobile]
MKFEKKFDKAKESINNNLIKALEEIGKLVTAESQMNTPVDTGNLRRSQGYKVNKDRVEIGSNIDYASFVHEGTSKQKAQPFLKDAVMENIEEIREIAKEHLSKVGDK